MCPKSRLLALVVGAILFACGPSVSQNGDGGNGNGDGGGGTCTDGVTRCQGKTLQTCSGGKFHPTEECPNECHDSLGCVLCQPGTGSCDGNTSHACRPDGQGYVDYHCDPVQGVMCDFKTGLCQGPCAPQNLGQSYIGCEYYPTVTGNIVLDYFQFAVAVANTSSEVASVTIEEGALTAPITFQVNPGDVVVRKLPWVPELKMCTETQPPGLLVECGAPESTGALRAKGAYHLRSTRPVTVYQFNPLDYTDGSGAYSYTNDASLLLPTNALTGNYVVAAWPKWDSFAGPFPSLMAITAVQDGTTVAINVRASTQGGGGSPPFAAGVPQMITLNRGDVIELASVTGDLTGSVVQANKPVQVIGGHYCTNVPLDTPYCDHLEESIFPVETLSTKYIVTAAAVPPIPNGKEQVIRIVATQQSTTVMSDPPIPGLPATLAGTGDYLEFPRRPGDYLIMADQKILVAQYMEGQEAGGGTGDPAMTLAVATDQYRTTYLFHAPTNYEVNYVNVTAPMGATVMVDDVMVTGFTPIGGSGFGVARVTLGPGTNGNHLAVGDQPFGVSVYGYGQYTSYWYPGGLDLAEIPVE